MDKSFLLQQQIRNNSEDLQKEVLDLKAWEQEMKRKDAELRLPDEQVFFALETFCFYPHMNWNFIFVIIMNKQ